MTFSVHDRSVREAGGPGADEGSSGTTLRSPTSRVPQELVPEPATPEAAETPGGDGRSTAFPRSAGRRTPGHSRALRRVRATWSSMRSSRRPTGLEVALVAVITAAVQVLVFRDYYLGVTAPTGDFLGGYHNEAFAWWNDGGLLDPPDWLPHLWGGYPAVASIQNSSWYLPVGLASLIGYDVHVAASLQALHVAFAGLGVYVLGRRAGFGRPAAVVGLVAYSLTTGFFSNAPYVDIVRGHAFAPWLLLLLSPLFPWRQWWSVPAASVFLWQVAVSTYPGMLVAFAYAGGAWALTWQLLRRPALRHFVLPALLAAVIALLLSMPKYLPLLQLGLLSGREVTDLSVLPPTTLGTFLLPSYPGIPGVPTLESFWLPVTALVLAALVNFRQAAVRAALAAAVLAVLLAAPNLPLRGLVDILPGVGLSRFRINDFRPFVWLPLVIAAMSGFQWLLGHRETGHPVVALWRRVVLVLAIPAGAATFLAFGRYRESDWTAVTVVLVLAAVVVLGLVSVAWRRGLGRRWTVAVTVIMVVLTGTSGLAYSRTVGAVWSEDTLAVQTQLWGATSTELIEHRATPASMWQRPARSRVPADYDQQGFISKEFNSAYYTGALSTGGYLNIHGSPSFVMARQLLGTPEMAEGFRELMAAPGIVIGRGSGEQGLPDADDVQQCVDLGRCGSVDSTPISYEPGQLVYQVDVKTPGQVLLNEAYYVGWSALLMSDSGRAVVVEPELGPGGTVMLLLPPGDWRVSVTYRTPLERPAYALAGLGVLLISGWAVIGRRRSLSVGAATA